MSLFLQHSDQYLSRADEIYDIIVAAVFGFSSINILALVTGRSDHRRSKLNFGEILAVVVVVLSVGFLGWEMLHIYHIFPIKLRS
jgi:hypothetical protein